MTKVIYVENLNNAIKEVERLELYKLDSDTKFLKTAFDILYRHEVFNLYDVALTEHNDYKFILFSHLTKVSGSLAFLGIQILAANVIMLMNNFPKREEYFAKQCGIAINHLRVPITVVSATKCEGGYRLKGKLTWASGYEIFDTLLIGFHHEGKEYEAMAAFKNSENFVVGEIATSFVGNSMATVNIELNDFVVKDENVVSSQLMGNYSKKKSLSKTVHFALYGGKSILIEEKMQRYYRELIMFNSNGLNHEIKGLFKEEFLNN